MNTRKKHQKHAQLARPIEGNFHTNEWAILGTTCSNIQELSRLIAKSLKDEFHLGYVDAAHSSEKENSSRDNFHNEGFKKIYTDKINYHCWKHQGIVSDFNFRNSFLDVEGVLVNGNHFKAERQIVVIDPIKADSLQRKKERLSNIEIVLLAEGVTEIPFYIQTILEEQGKEVPVLSLEAVGAVVSLLREKLKNATPPLWGLVLAGGKSRRMGRDKGKIEYNGMPQRTFMLEQLQGVCEEAYISCRPEQASDPELFGMPLLFDSFLGLGPMGAILSAFRAHPKVAWLVVACDLPLLDKKTLQELIAARNPSKLATSFHNPSTGFPEPLVSIWEPRSYAKALNYLSQGYSCPRKLLINEAIEEVKIGREEALLNVNSPEDVEKLSPYLDM